METSELVRAIALKADSNSPMWVAWSKLNLAKLVDAGKVDEAWELLLEAARESVPELVKSVENKGE
jgi:hypothetical protein